MITLYYMKPGQVSGYLLIFFILFILLSPIALAQGRYNEAPYYNSSYTPDPSKSFWQLSDLSKLIYATSMAATFIVLLKAFPFLFGRFEDLQNKNRQDILNFVYHNPGVTVANVAQAHNIDRGTAKYHLYRLESEGKIILRRIGKFSRIFQNSETYSDFEKTVLSYMQNQTARSILLMILEQPGITNLEMADRLCVEKSAIKWHLDNLMRDGIVKYRQDRRFKRHFLSDNSRAILEKHADFPG
jgi:Uncharacterized protein conserved in archaea